MEAEIQEQMEVQTITPAAAEWVACIDSFLSVATLSLPGELWLVLSRAINQKLSFRFNCE